MPIIELQRRLAEIGRIRLGRQVESRGGKKRPAALDTFRLTSTDQQRIIEAAERYGGTVTKWDESPSGIPQWEVVTTSDKLPVVVPPSAMAFSQDYELWSAGGCQRRCDGVKERISDQPCLCDPENRQCEIHTRLSVMLRDLAGLGVWRVDTQGYYAAVELQGAVEVISLAAGHGQMLPATLRLDQRSIKRADEGVKRFVVPVLDIEVSPAQLLMGTIAVASPKQAALTPVPQSEEKPASIADQVKAADSQPSRRRAAPIPSTGISPRPAAGAPPVIEATPEPDPWGPAPPPRERPQTEAEQTQDPPRMCTRGQLTKLGILLGKLGFTDKSVDGKAARMDFCREALRLLIERGEMKQESWSGRKLSSSTELTFDEISGLIEFFEAAEKEAEKAAAEAVEKPAPEPEPEPEPDAAAVSENGHPDPEPDDSEPESVPAEDNPDQMSLLGGDSG